MSQAEFDYVKNSIMNGIRIDNASCNKNREIEMICLKESITNPIMQCKSEETDIIVSFRFEERRNFTLKTNFMMTNIIHNTIIKYLTEINTQCEITLKIEKDDGNIYGLVHNVIAHVFDGMCIFNYTGTLLKKGLSKQIYLNTIYLQLKLPKTFSYACFYREGVVKIVEDPKYLEECSCDIFVAVCVFDGKKHCKILNGKLTKVQTECVISKLTEFIRN